jgi:hypothetical protein
MPLSSNTFLAAAVLVAGIFATFVFASIFAKKPIASGANCVTENDLNMTLA